MVREEYDIKDFEDYNMWTDFEKVKRALKGLQYVATPESRELYVRYLENVLKKITVLKVENDRPFVKVPPFKDGPILIGNYMQGGKEFHECRVQPDDLIHFSITAAIGKGKTRTVMHLICEIVKQNATLPFELWKVPLMWDVKGDDFQKLPFEKVVLDLAEIPFNPWDPPPGVPFKEWAGTVSQIFMHSFKTHLPSQYKLFDVAWDYHQAHKKPPTFFDIYEGLLSLANTWGKASYRNREILDVVFDRVNNLTDKIPSLRYRKSFPLHQFVEDAVPLVLKLDATSDVSNFCVSWMSYYVLMLHKYSQVRGNISSGGVIPVFDEASEIYERESDYSDFRKEFKAGPMIRLPTLCRSFSMNLWAASQRPSSRDLMTSCNTKMVGYLGEYDDVQQMANSLGDPRLAEVIPKLKEREFLIKIGDMDAAIVKVPDIELWDVKNEHLPAMMKPYTDLIMEACREDEDEKDERKRSFPPISPTALELLKNLAFYPDWGVALRYQKLGINAADQKAVVAELLTRGLCELVQEKVFEKSGKYLVPTPAGLDRLRAEGIDVKDCQHVGYTTAKHALFQNIVVHYLKDLRYNVLHDHDLSGKTVDVYAEKEKKLAIEVVVNPEEIDKKRLVASKEAVDCVIFLCSDRVVMNNVQSQTALLQDGKIEYYIASDYLSALRQQVRAYYANIKKNTGNSQKESNLKQPDREKTENKEREEEEK